MERDIEESEREASDAVTAWQQSYEALESQNRELTAETEALSEEVRSLKEIKFSLSEELNQYKDLEAEARTEISALHAKVSSFKSNLTSDGLSMEELENLLSLKEQELYDMTVKLDQTTKERDEAFGALEGLRGEEAVAPVATSSDSVIDSAWSDDLEDIDMGEEVGAGAGGPERPIEDSNTRPDEAYRLTKAKDETTEALTYAQEMIDGLTREQQEGKTDIEDLVKQWTGKLVLD